MLEYPAGHDAHVFTVFPTSVVMNLPASQASHAVKVPLENFPTGQALHPSEAFMYLPAVHAAQSVDAPAVPASAVLPASQAPHAVKFAVENFPAAQLVQSAAPALEILPDGHVMHPSVMFAVAEYLPAAHATQSVAFPAVPTGAVLPGSQASQAVKFALENFPTGQVWQEPVELYWPAVHAAAEG